MKHSYKSIYLTLLTLIAALMAQAQTIQIGTGVQTSGNTTASPVNGYYEYMRYQTVYTAAEINAQGVSGTSNITTIAYYVTTPPAGGLPNFAVRMANITATDASAHVATVVTQVYSSVSGPTLVANSWNTITLATPFQWDGTSNLLVDVVFGPAPFTTPYGSLYTFTSTNGSRYVRCDGCGSQANATTTATQNTKPQVQMTFVALGGCTGTPVAGTASSPASVCDAADFSLVLTGTTAASGIDLQWQSSADNVIYADMSGATTASIVTSQSSATYYRAIATCTNSGASDTSNVVYVTMNSFLNCYCPSVAGNTADTKIDSVSFLTVTTGSGPATCEDYTDYSSQVGTISQGDALAIAIKNGSCSGNHYGAGVAIYVDYNQNGTFELPGETAWTYYPTTGINTIPTANFLIPNNAVLGQTRMRIIISEGGISGPCDSYGYGETEDYTLNIVAAPPCTDPPTPGTITAPSSVCPTTVSSLLLTGYTLGTQLQWESSADGINYTAIPGAVNALYTTDPIVDTIFYRVKVKCADSIYTTPVEIDINPFMTCYCTTGLGGSCGAGNAEINNVNIVGTTLNNNSSCTSISADAYTAFPDTGSATATLLLTVPYTLNVNTSDAAIISVWIDYNQDGVFDASEWTQVATNSQNGSITITVPNNALQGQTVMRVRSRLTGNQNGATDACLNFGSGEAEDYLITLGPAPACAIPPVGGTVTGPSTGTGGNNYQFVLIGSTGTIQWQYSAVSATGPFLPVLGATNDTLVAVFTSGTYWLRAYLTSPGCDPDSSNALQVVITLPGDDVCDARSLGFGVNGPYVTTYASAQTGEPAPPAGGCTTPGNWCDSVITNSLWFSFVAPASGRVSIQSPDFDTQLALWSAPSCNSILTGGGTLIAANDDDTNSTLHGGVNFSSYIEAVCLTPGTTYYVQLDPYNAPGDTTRVILTDLGGVTVSLTTQTNVTCFGLTNGAIDMTVTGGSGSYVYTWSNGGTTEDLSGLAAGSYTLTVHETGCVASVVSGPVTITQPAAIIPSLDSLVNEACFGGTNGGIYVTVTGGTPPYTYAWSDGSSNEDLTGVPAGTYTGTVTDANGCFVASPSIPITEPAQLVVTVDLVTDNICAGVANGAIDISVTGGTPAYSFAWSNTSTTEDISSLAGGTYNVTVTDAAGCLATASATVNNGLGISVSVNAVTDNTCAGLTTGAIDITASGGSSYTYNWSNGASTEDVSSLAAGSYSVSVTDVSGCTAGQSAIVNNATTVAVSVDAVTNNACAGLTTGSVDISASGGTPTYTFNWSNGASTEDIDSLAAGTFNVSVTDASGCTATAGAVITDNAGVSVSVDSTADNICQGLTTGAVNISASGGTPNYTFNWSNGATSEDISSLASGTFNVTVQDVAGCSATASATLTDLTSVTAAVDSSRDVTCNGLNNGAVYITVTGGTAAYTFGWSNAATSEDITGLDGGTYSVSVTDANGCSATSGPVTITEPPVLTFTLDSVHNVKCFGASTGAAFTTVAGGTAGYSTLWSNSATSADITTLAAGAYTATTTDANGCTASVSATITQPASALSVTSVITNQIQGGAMGAINITISGGTSPYASLWSNSSTTEDQNNLTAGVYTATITDANGCTTVIRDTVKLVTGIGEMSASIGINIYPNPSQDKVFLDLMLSQSADVAVDVLNIDGQLVQQYGLKNALLSKIEMNFGNEAAGVYYAKIKVGETTLTRKIVITR